MNAVFISDKGCTEVTGKHDHEVEDEGEMVYLFLQTASLATDLDPPISAPDPETNKVNTKPPKDSIKMLPLTQLSASTYKSRVW